MTAVSGRAARIPHTVPAPIEWSPPSVSTKLPCRQRVLSQTIRFVACGNVACIDRVDLRQAWRYIAKDLSALTFSASRLTRSNNLWFAVPTVRGICIECVAVTNAAVSLASPIAYEREQAAEGRGRLCALALYEGGSFSMTSIATSPQSSTYQRTCASQPLSRTMDTAISNMPTASPKPSPSNRDFRGALRDPSSEGC